MADCCCNGKLDAKLIYACSGSANTGLLADQVARKLAREGAGKMTCLGLPFLHFVMTEYGAEKGKTPITEELIGSVSGAVKAQQTCGC